MKSVKDYYNNLGWTKHKGKYIDTVTFSSDKGIRYKELCAKKLKEKIGESNFLLDVACGAMPFDSYAKKQLCIDFSSTAIREAKKNKPGDFFVLGDITCLPLKDNSVDDSLSLHTIYHVHKDKQHIAISELKRVTKTLANTRHSLIF